MLLVKGEIMEDYKKMLKDKNLKVTKGRLAVLELLNASKVPMNAEQIYEDIDKEAVPSFTSLYRILKQLADEDLLKKNLYSNGLLYYETAKLGHRHFIICSKCGKISSIEKCPLHEFDEAAAKETGYVVEYHSVELVGICPECQKKDE
jgi:Fur family ferric uptake transcriptional regulator